MRAAALLLLAVVGCRAANRNAAAPLTATVAGTVAVDGLSAPVRVTRDRWGVPHIYATTVADLFVAQGFVQAQDRLFQIDLWRRAAQGRLAEVLGPNFIERDAMTRRMQYRGDLDAEWASYGPDARAIAGAFVRGVNAWVAMARERPPESFVLAGWKPDFWEPADLLNRTDAFVASGDAIAEISRRQLSGVIADAIRRVGTPPFFSGLAATVRVDRSVRLQADRELVSPVAYQPADGSRADVRDGVIVVAESSRTFEHPSPRYIVHLVAPGWNVIGAAAPWRPGVAIGHNDRVAWGLAPVDADTQDIEVVATGSPDSRVVKDAIAVKGRAEPFEYETELTPHGVVVATDRARGQSFALRWTGLEAGAAPEMASLALDVAQSPADLDAAIARWRMPPRKLTTLFEGQGGPAVPASPARPARPASPGRPASRAVFAHVLGVTDAARRRFSVGPIDRPPRDDQPFRALLDPQSWDRSRIVNAPGQSESPDSPHFSDLAKLWSAGEMIPLLFSDGAIASNAEATLTLIPRR